MSINRMDGEGAFGVCSATTGHGTATRVALLFEEGAVAARLATASIPSRC